MSYWGCLGDVSSKIYNKIFGKFDIKYIGSMQIVMILMLIAGVILQVRDANRVAVFAVSLLPITYAILLIPSVIKYIAVKSNGIIKADSKDTEQITNELKCLKELKEKILNSVENKWSLKTSFKEVCTICRCVIEKYGEEVFEKFHINNWEHIWLSNVHLINTAESREFIKHLDIIEVYEGDVLKEHGETTDDETCDELKQLFKVFTGQCMNYYNDIVVAKMLAYEFMSRVKDIKVLYILVNTLIMDYYMQIRGINKDKKNNDSEYIRYIDISVLMDNKVIKELLESEINVSKEEPDNANVSWQDGLNM